MAPKKTVKMNLDEFINNEAFGAAPSGSWADEDMPLPSFGVSSTSSAAPGGFDALKGDWSANKRGPVGGFQREMRPPREELPVPDVAPFYARLANLDYSVTEEVLEELFANEPTISIRVVIGQDGRPRGFGFVEFETKEALERALQLTGQQLLGRELSVHVAEKRAGFNDEKFDGDWRSNRPGPLEPREPREPADDRDYDNWERRGPLPPPEGERRRQSRFDDKERDFDNWERRGPLPTRRGGRRMDLPADKADTWRGEKPAAPSRPRIKLAPRTVGAHEATPETAPARGGIFGSAKPIDTTKKLLEVEQKAAQQEQAKIDAVKHKWEKKQQQRDEAEQVRKRFDVLKTEDDEEEAPKAAAAAAVAAVESKKKDEPTEAEKILAAEASKAELESDDWEVVKDKRRK